LGLVGAHCTLALPHIHENIERSLSLKSDSPVQSCPFEHMQCLNHHLPKPQDSGDGKIQQRSRGVAQDRQFDRCNHPVAPEPPGLPSIRQKSGSNEVAPSRRPLHPATSTGITGRSHSCPAPDTHPTLLGRMFGKERDDGPGGANHATRHAQRRGAARPDRQSASERTRVRERLASTTAGLHASIRTRPRLPHAPRHDAARTPSARRMGIIGL